MADTRKQYPYGADNVPVGYVLMHYADGAFWVDPEPKWETPLTVERLVRVLREVIASERGSIGENNLLRRIIEALDNQEVMR